MKAMIKPFAAAVSLALASAAAHAQLAAPGFGTTAPANNQLMLAIWDGNDTASQIVTLNYTYADLTTGFNPTSPASPYTLATNPSTGTGSVYQLNFGTVPGWSTNFANPTTQNTQYLLGAMNAIPGNAYDVTSVSAPVLNSNLQADVVNALSQEVTSWAQVAGTAGSYFDATGGTLLSINSATSYYQSGTMQTVTQQFGAAVGTALNFYNVGQVPRGQASAPVSAFAGFFYLSSTGQLTYNIPAAVSAVPLPAAVWLLASGVAGLGAIGRRRRIEVA